MTRRRRLHLLVPLGAFVLACQALSSPVSVSQELALTAAAAVTQAVGIGTEMAPMATMFALQTLAPGLGATTVPGGGNIFDPQGTPVAVWKEIPVMPQAYAGEEVEGVYSFRILASTQEVQQFYASQLPGLGWTEVLSAPDLPFLLYTKGELQLSITIADPDEDGTIVLLAVQ